jgi:hypothetical protein
MLLMLDRREERSALGLFGRVARGGTEYEPHQAGAPVRHAKPYVARLTGAQRAPKWASGQWWHFRKAE